MGRTYRILSAEKFGSWRICEIGGEREAGIANFFSLVFSQAKKKKAFENHRKGQKRVTEKAAVVGLLWIPRNSFGFC